MEVQGTAVVTGASRGIGRAVALRLAQVGFDVLATMRDPDDGAGLAEEAGDNGSIEVAPLDVTRPETISLPDDLRVLVNNAGIEQAYLPVEHAPLDDWRSVFEVNVFGLVDVTRRAVPVLREAGGGVICNVTSSSLLAPQPLYAVYRASKAAVQALGESLRAEVAAFGIRVLEVLPGPIDTDMLAASAKVPEAASYPEYAQLAEATHQGRLSVEPMITSTQDAAADIVAAILDDDAPLRIPCDPLGRDLLAGWSATPDEEWQQQFLG